MTKKRPELTRPIISIMEGDVSPTERVKVDLVPRNGPFFFSTLELAIRALRALDHEHAYLNDSGVWCAIHWSKVLSPWDGPDI